MTAADILAALHAGELELHYQPQVATATRAPCAAEALIRWRHPGHGLLGAASVVPALEAGPLDALASVCRATLHRACRDTAGLDESEHLGIAVNISARDIGRASLVEDVVEALLATNLAPHRLEIEITETAPLDDTPGVRRTLAELRELGVRIALDDFGTGHATLAALDLVAPNTLKLPRELIGTVTQGGAGAVREALALAAAREIDVVAEGVETESEYAWCALHRVPVVQGYLTGRPMPLGEYRAHVARGPERAVLSA